MAKAMGYLARTDRIDARMLAEYGATLLASNKIAGCTFVPLSAEQQALSDMAARRRQLVTLLGAEPSGNACPSLMTTPASRTPLVILLTNGDVIACSSAP